MRRALLILVLVLLAGCSRAAATPQAACQRLLALNNQSTLGDIRDAAQAIQSVIPASVESDNSSRGNTLNSARQQAGLLLQDDASGGLFYPHYLGLRDDCRAVVA